MFLFDQSVRFLGRNTATVLVFHKVPLVADPLEPDDPDLAAFIAVLDMVMEHFTIVPLDEVVAKHLARKLPKNAACLTFDDGYADWSKGLVPVLLKRSAHATFFVTTGQFDGTPLWHERVIHAVRHSIADVLDLTHMGMSPLPVKTIADKRIAIANLQVRLKYESVAQRDSWLDQLEFGCNVEKSFVSVMSKADLRTLHSKGFAIGSHTTNHPILTRTTSSEAFQEIGRSREQLEAVIGGKVDSFAYPNGRPTTDFSPDHVALVKSAGYRYSVTTRSGVLRQETDPYLIPRFAPWGPGQSKMLFQILRNQVFK